MRVQGYALKLAREAKQASQALANVEPALKTRLLRQVASQMAREKSFLLCENEKDLKNARANGLPESLQDRLLLNEKRLSDIMRSVEAVAGLPDPIGRILVTWKRPNGLKITKVSVPLGSILIIYEARPNVTSECASLGIKSGNSMILKGGKEAFFSNRAIARIFQGALRRCGLPESAVSFVAVTDRRVVSELLKLSDSISLVIPRGGESLIRKVASQSKIPVIKHYRGNCHVYVDRDADLEMAEKIVFNAKCQRPAVCNAAETLLVHRSVARAFLPRIATRLREAGCELRGDPVSRRILPGINKASEEDWYREYLDLILAVRVVEDVNQAVEHIQKYGSQHTDAIVSENPRTQREFVKRVDSSSVMVNTTTRFSDGFQYGFGAEIGISTDKIHARGPMGLEGLTSYKYVVEGRGQLRE